MRISDWSSDVCSSDLLGHRPLRAFGMALSLAHARRKAVRGTTRLLEPRRQSRLFRLQPIQGGTGILGKRRLPPPVGRKSNGCILHVAAAPFLGGALGLQRSEEHTSELQSLMRISY